MTKNTKLYKINYKKGKEVYYRTLTILEVSFLTNIKNEAVRAEMAGKQALYNEDPDNIPYGLLLRIGNESLYKSQEPVSDVRMLEITVDKIRKDLDRDDALIIITQILQILPGQSITDLLNLSYTDLIEIACMCEKLSGDNIFDFKQNGKKKTKLVDPSSLSKSQKQSLEERINSLK